MSGSSSAAVGVRPATPDDAEGLAVAHVRAWQVAYRGSMPDEFLDGLEVARYTAGWARRLADPSPASVVIVAVADSRVVGFAVYGAARDPESGDAGELHAINVHPHEWERGVGSALLTAAHHGLADLGYSIATLWVVTGNVRARRFYERHGWSADDIERVDDRFAVPIAEVRYSRPLIL